MKNVNGVKNENAFKRFVFTKTQVEAAKLWAQGFTLAQISENLGVKYTSQLSRALSDFHKVAPYLRQAVQELSNVGYFLKLHKSKFEGFKAALDAEEQLASFGKWPLSFRSLPWGYVLEKDRSIKVDPEKRPILERAFKACADGGIPDRVAKQLGIPRYVIRNILKNEIYKGNIRFRGKIYHFEHLRVVDDETWNRANDALMGGPRPPPPFGFKWAGKELVQDEQKIEKLRLMFKLRAQGKGCPEIARIIGVHHIVVYRSLKNPFYKERGIISPEAWDAIQKVKIGSKELMKRLQEKYVQKIKEENKAKILLYLKSAGPSTFMEIQKAVNLSNPCVADHLKKLKKLGLVDKEPKHKGRWYLIPNISKSQF
jgi:DNA invertase Pin-like site-specific DNA recombinase